MPPPSEKLESMISREGNLGVLLLMKAAIRVFVKIDLVVAQLAQKGQIAGPVLIRILVSREPSSEHLDQLVNGAQDRRPRRPRARH